MSRRQLPEPITVPTIVIARAEDHGPCAFLGSARRSYGDDTKSSRVLGDNGFVVFNMQSGGLAELAQLKPNVEGMQALGYSIYMMTILGTWKVLGSTALLAPRFPWLKEWAYAGIFFNMTGAAVSHLVVGDEAWHVWYTASLAIVVLVSWAP